MEAENPGKSLKFLDLKITNTKGEYTFMIHRKNAIKNVQVKPHSAHDPKILKSIFTRCIHRAYATRKQNQREEEIDFLIRCFAENGYNENELKKIAKKYYLKMMTSFEREPEEQQQHHQHHHRHSALDTRLQKSFKKAGYKTIIQEQHQLENHPDMQQVWTTQQYCSWSLPWKLQLWQKVC